MAQNKMVPANHSPSAILRSKKSQQETMTVNKASNLTFPNSDTIMMTAVRPGVMKAWIFSMSTVSSEETQSLFICTLTPSVMNNTSNMIPTVKKIGRAHV